MSVSGGKNESKSRSRVEIPDFLRPFVTQATGIAGGALSNLQRDINGGNLVAGFTPAQELAQMLGIDRALGGGDFFPVAQETMLNAARGQGVESFLPEASFGALTESAGGTSLDQFISPEALEVFRGGASGDSFLESLRSRGLPSQSADAISSVMGRDLQGVDGIIAALSGGAPASAVQRLMSGVNGGDVAGMDSLAALRSGGVPADAMSRLASGTQGGDLAGSDILSQLTGEGVPQQTRDTLEATARGDFLFGGEGFDAAVEAAVRAAQPGIISAFGRAGAGGATGGLSRTAIGQAGIDAFARQFGDERGRQMSAAGTLGSLGLQDVGQRADIASTLSGLDLSQRGQELDAAGNLADVGLRDVGQRADISSVLANLGLSQRGQELGSAEALAGIGLSERGQTADISSMLASLGLAQDDQQLGAAGLLGELGLAETGQQADITSMLNSLRQGSAGALADLSSTERGRGLSSAGLLADLGLSERGNQLNAAGALPDLAEADLGLLDRIGATQQDLEQLRRMAPIDAQMQLLTAALSGLPISSFLGQNTRASSREFSFTGDV